MEDNDIKISFDSNGNVHRQSISQQTHPPEKKSFLRQFLSLLLQSAKQPDV